MYISLLFYRDFMPNDMTMKKNFLLLIITALLFVSCKESEKKETVHKYTNALIEETSPYLLQHAHNPVDWRPWSEEALAEAAENDKLVLVSIGYSSCQVYLWCFHCLLKQDLQQQGGLFIHLLVHYH